jgi:hypothetical protein
MVKLNDFPGSGQRTALALKHGVRPHGGMDRRVLAVALHEEVGGNASNRHKHMNTDQRHGVFRTIL